MTTGGGGGSLQKVTLTKAAPTVSLTKGSGATGQMRVNLNWNAGTKGLFRKAQSIDLDLGCLYELTDGSKGVVQALGNAFGRLDGPPSSSSTATTGPAAPPAGRTCRSTWSTCTRSSGCWCSPSSTRACRRGAARTVS